MGRIYYPVCRALSLLLISVACTENSNNSPDWLIKGSSYVSVIKKTEDHLVMTNGLISRTFSLSPDGATIAFSNILTGSELLRSVKPEAIITINGTTMKIGGLTGQPVNNYLTGEWISQMKADTLSPFMLTGYRTGEILPRFEWKKRLEWMPKDLPWPPPGKTVDFTYSGRKTGDLADGTEVVVHYEIYDGIPLICKWITIENHSAREIVVNSYISEILAFTEVESAVGDKKNWILTGNLCRD